MVELRKVRPEAAVSLSESVALSGHLPRGWQEHTDPIPYEVDLELVQQLCHKAATFFAADQMDSWLAPRLHCALRFSRRVASDEGMWAWLALQNPEFIDARFRKGKERVHGWRYRGSWSRNGLARLWWGAEMTRNGPDYSATAACFKRTRTAQFALELMYSWDRGAAIAFTRVTEGLGGTPRLSDDETRLLSTRLKTLLALRSLGAIGFIDEEVAEFDARWAEHRPSFSELAANDVTSLRGPEAGSVAPSRIAAIEKWFITIADGSGGLNE